MTGSDLADFLGRHAGVVRIRVARAAGSAPREEGASMFVARDGVIGTIGGGQLEYMALDEARKMLATGKAERRMDVPLGPEIGQCCGGRVELALDLLTEDRRAAIVAEDEHARAGLPAVHVFGAGHVGRALARCLEPLPVRPVLIDTRAEELSLCTAHVEIRHSALPEAEIRSAPGGSAFVVLTHDHALDFLLSAEALARGDAVYVGMIGSATKRARFERFARETAPRVPVAELVCPIGARGSADKRPEVIAAFVAAEVMAALGTPAPLRRHTRGWLRTE